MSEERFRKALEMIDAQACECSENHGFMPACPHVIAMSALSFDEEGWASFVALGEDVDTDRELTKMARDDEADSGRSWEADIKRGLEDLAAGHVTDWDRRFVARLRRIVSLKKRIK